MKRRSYISFLRVPLVYIVLALAASAANVGVVDGGKEYNDLDTLVETVRALGHQAEKLPAAELCRPTGFLHYDCVILAHGSGFLTEPDYNALVEYVNEGGTLLMAGTAAYWMKTPDDERPRRRIAGAGPFKDAAGATITGFLECPIRELKVSAVTQATAGLPPVFVIETTPAYDVNNRSNWRGAGVLEIKADSAIPLIKVEMINRDGKIVESDFLTVKKFGQGQCYRTALSRIAPLVFARKEKHISRILQNVLNSAEFTCNDN